MSDGASDTSKVIFASRKTRNAFGQPHRLVPSPTLVPSAPPSSSDDIVRQLLSAIAGTKAGPVETAAKSADGAQDPSVEIQNAPDQPAPSEAEIGPDSPPQDTLKLLSELARKSNSLPTVDAPAVQPDATPVSDSPAVAIVDDLKPADRTTEPQSPARTGASRHRAAFAIVCCAAILASGMTGLFLWSRAIPAPTVPAAVPAVEARPDTPSVQTVMAECDLAAAKNPYAGFFVNPNTLSSNGRQTAEPSAADYGRYSLRSLKATLERRGSGC